MGHCIHVVVLGHTLCAEFQIRYRRNGSMKSFFNGFRAWSASVVRAQLDDDDEIVDVWVSSDYYENRTWVRNEDWQQAINDYKKAKQPGEEGMSAYTREKKAIADRMPVMSEVHITSRRRMCSQVD